MEHAKHIIRAVLLIFFLVACVEIFRQTMLPESFGELGPFRANAIKEMTEYQPVYSDSESCRSCHQTEHTTVTSSKHRSIDCQMCHAPLTVHVQKNERIAEMPINSDPKWCLRCHEKLQARPEGLKQIVLQQHAEDFGFTDTKQDGLCLECHTAHEPNL